MATPGLPVHHRLAARQPGMFAGPVLRVAGVLLDAAQPPHEPVHGLVGARKPEFDHQVLAGALGVAAGGNLLLDPGAVGLAAALATRNAAGRKSWF